MPDITLTEKQEDPLGKTKMAQLFTYYCYDQRFMKRSCKIKLENILNLLKIVFFLQHMPATHNLLFLKYCKICKNIDVRVCEAAAIMDLGLHGFTARLNNC